MALLKVPTQQVQDWARHYPLAVPLAVVTCLPRRRQPWARVLGEPRGENPEPTRTKDGQVTQRDNGPEGILCMESLFAWGHP